jgi:hypothetical protein
VETDSIVGSVLERRPGEINLLEHSLASFNDLSSPSSVQSRTEDTTGKQHPERRGGKGREGVGGREKEKWGLIHALNIVFLTPLNFLV